MDTANIQTEFNRLASELHEYATYEMPRMALRKTLRYIEGNFRRQGWQGRSFLPWKKNLRGGTILVDKGNLRRSIHGNAGPGEIYVYSNSPYARVHNRGFNGTVRVKSYTRYKYTETKVPTGRLTKSGTPRTMTVHQQTGSTEVAAHTRKMNVPRRQFMPENMDDSPDLFDSIKRQVVKDIKNITR